jgi:hypothetical protein
MDVNVDRAGTFASALEPGERIIAFGVGPDDDALALVVGRAEGDLIAARTTRRLLLLCCDTDRRLTGSSSTTRRRRTPTFSRAGSDPRDPYRDAA